MRPISLLLLLAVFCLVERAFAASPCAATDQAAKAVVQLQAHRLWLCAPGEEATSYRVALGRGGIDKQREGDGKTPIGEYPLGAPRASAKFSLFIPVAYPTDAQRQAGYTGSDIGIHGPPTNLSLFGIFSTWVDWTAGCIAVATRPQIVAVAQWLREHHVSRVSLVRE